MEAQNSITLSDITNLLELGALLRVQDQWHLVWGPFEASRDPINQEVSILCPNFYDTVEASYLSGARYAKISSELLSALLESFLHSKANFDTAGDLSQVKWLEPDFNAYAQFFNDVQKKIQQGEIRKAVPVVFAKATRSISVFDRARMLQHLVKTPQTLFAYGFWDANSGILGATPEVLFASTNSEIKTMALAGTCPKVVTSPRLCLLDDPKEMEEHRLVVEDISEVMRNFGILQMGKAHLLELPTLWHIKTDLSVLVADNMNFKNLVQKLHPTPALGVFPRSAGYHWMRHYADQERRARFGAPFMFVFPEKNEAICLVAIRNLQWNGDEVFLGSGAGVVAASQIEREWQELSQKRNSVKMILGVLNEEC